VLQLANESSYTHKNFTLFKQAPYLQYHPEYKKPATEFPAILDSFLTEVHCGSTASFRRASSWVEVEAVGGQGYTLNKMNWVGVRVKQTYVVMGH